MGEALKLEDIELGLTLKDMENMNVDSLKKLLVHSQFITIAALFSQAKDESIRTTQLREYIDKVEKDLFSDKIFATLLNEEKIELYKHLNKGLTGSLGFLTKLNDNMSKGMEATSILEKNTDTSKGKRRVLTEDEASTKKSVMALVESKIKEKLKSKGRGDR
jgi:hypothetical protein